MTLERITKLNHYSLYQAETSGDLTDLEFRRFCFVWRNSAARFSSEYQQLEDPEWIGVSVPLLWIEAIRRYQ